MAVNKYIITIQKAKEIYFSALRKFAITINKSELFVEGSLLLNPIIDLAYAKSKEDFYGNTRLRVGIGFFCYKKLREIQSTIKFLLSNISNLKSLKLFQNIEWSTYCKNYEKINFFCSPSIIVNQFKTKLEDKLRIKKQSFNKQLKLFYDLARMFKLSINSSQKNFDLFNLSIFILSIKFYQLEAKLQYLNWLLFSNNFDNKKLPFFFKKHIAVKTFFNVITDLGYDNWRKKHFNLNRITFKLQKKWKFWREFKKRLLFNRLHILVKFKWLHSIKRLLKKQFLFFYAVDIDSKLKTQYAKNLTNARFLLLLAFLESRVDILIKRFFFIKTFVWVWLLLYFSYITINLKKVNKHYILKQHDLIFGWLLIKNSHIYKHMRIAPYTKASRFNFIEYDGNINSFIFLSHPVKYSKFSYNIFGFSSEKFFKYTYLNTY